MIFSKIKRKSLFVSILILSLSILLGCSPSTVENKEITVVYNSKDYVGNYTGSVDDNVPNGDGSFSSATDDLVFNGTWEAGLPLTGKIKTDNFIINFSNFERVGEYEGSIVDGKASGDGTFSSTNPSGVKYKHTGLFSDNRLNGFGVTVYEDDSTPDLAGNFTNGEFTPTIGQYFNALVLNNKDDVYITTNASDFIEANEDIFTSSNDFSSLIQGSFEYSKYSKSQTSYGNGLYTASSLDIIQISEYQYLDKTVTGCTALDSNGNVYMLHYLGSVDIYENDNVNITFVPLNYISYDTIAGNTNFAVNCAVAEISKN